jgi:hypothetical protein
VTPPKATTAAVHAALAELDAAPVVSMADRERAKHLAASKQRRQDLSDDALMLECLFDLFDFDTDERGFMHAVVARSLGKAPEQRIIVNELELGRQLKGDAGVLEGSVKKRARRMFAQVDAKQRAAGRLALRREPGKVILGSSKEAGSGKRFAVRGQKKLVSAEYFAPLVQAVVDGVSMARPGHERRMVRFRRAARCVFDALPECAPLPAPERVTPAVRSAAEVSVDEEQPAKAVKQPRPLKKFKDGAALVLRAAKERDARAGRDSSEDFDRQAALLYVELGRTIAEVQGVETVEVLRHTVERLNALLEAPDELSSLVALTDTSVATKSILDTPAEVPHFSEAESPKPQQKGMSGPRRLDKSVQATRLSAAFVQEARDRADLVRVVEDAGVKLKRGGSEYKGCCPFHQEKTPSFSVNRAKGVYHCHGCGQGGNVYNFVMETQGLGFRDAVLHVAGTLGMSPPEAEPALAPKPPPTRPRELVIVPDPEPVGGVEFEL